MSVGVNSGTSPPAVPKIFRWQFDPNNEVVAMWHPGMYMYLVYYAIEYVCIMKIK